MAPSAHPPHTDDALAAQVAAREVASRQDAAVLAPMRSEAAARALGLELPRPEPAPRATPGEADGVLPPTPPVPADSMAPAAAPTPPPAPPAPPSASGLLTLDDQPQVTLPSEPPTSYPAPATAPGSPPPGVVVPMGGPARVTTGVLAAAKAQRPPGEQPVMELRPTVLATDIDRIGDQLVVMKDRLELRDRHGGLRRTLAIADITDVQIQRRLTSAILVVTTRSATDMIIKGLRPESAETARQAILDLRPAEIPYVDLVDERSLMRAILELHRAGVLDDMEMAEKTALVARMTGRGRR